MSLNSTTRDTSLSLRQWFDKYSDELQEQTEFVYSQEITTNNGATYTKFASVDSNVGVRDTTTYLKDNYDEDFIHKTRRNVRIVSIR
jgi:hypothetical protein